MKSIKIYSLLLLTLFAACSDKEDEVDSAKISLEQEELIFKYGYDKVTLALNSDAAWEVKERPDWIGISPSSGNGSQEICLEVKHNVDYDDREFTLVFVAGNSQAKLKVKQTKRDINVWNLGFTDSDITECVVGDDGVKRSYKFLATKLFVNPQTNPEFNEKLFLANLVDLKMKSSTELTSYQGYTFVPISAFPIPFETEHLREYVPSKKNHDAHVQAVLKNLPKSGEEYFSNDGGVYYNSYRELNLIGRANMSTNLEELITKKSYKEQEMTKKNGMIFSFSNTLFSMYMDVQEHLIKEELDAKDFPNNSLGYISSVSYGQVGLLLIETNNKALDARMVVSKLFYDENAVLSAQESAILGELDAYHIYFDKTQRMQVKKGKSDAITSYRDQKKNMKNAELAFPYKFSVNDYFTRGIAGLEFSLVLE